MIYLIVDTMDYMLFNIRMFFLGIFRFAYYYTGCYLLFIHMHWFNRFVLDIMMFHLPAVVQILQVQMDH